MLKFSKEKGEMIGCMTRPSSKPAAGPVAARRSASLLRLG